MEKNKLNKIIWYEECIYRFNFPLKLYTNIINTIYELQEEKEKTLNYTL